MTEKKFAYYKEKIDVQQFEEKIGRFEPKWEQDLNQFLKNVPKIESIQKQVIKLLKEVF